MIRYFCDVCEKGVEDCKVGPLIGSGQANGKKVSFAISAEIPQKGTRGERTILCDACVQEAVREWLGTPESPKGEPSEGLDCFKSPGYTMKLPLGISFTCTCGNRFHVKWTQIMPRQFMCENCRRTYSMELDADGRNAVVFHRHVV